ncbi:right-handed parallel beta-helix repeat-containing protein [Kitasatospora sp. NBC_01560]|uniref:right-handed parallel beta-helix repeat-containing protein n=1 Tax=Kitasatospora sp. NBC_01560 TaxID=2975965 RepID=UPI0038648501
MLIGSIGLPAIGSADAVAGGIATLYVDNNDGANCTDAGNGSKAAPYCTVNAAAAVVQPGQTVEIQPGTYREAVLVTRSGNVGAPITFRSGGDGSSYATIGLRSTAGDGITVRNASNLRFDHLSVAPGIDGSVVVDGGHDVDFMRVDLSRADLHITNASSDVRFAAGALSPVHGRSPILVDDGSSRTLLTTNSISAGPEGVTGIAVKDAPGTVVVSNTVHSSCNAGIALSGASGGAVIENNVVDTTDGYDKPCADPVRATGISVAASATAGTKADYNLIDPRSGGLPYGWAGTAYPTQAALTAATGQGAHDFLADSWVSKGPDAPLDRRRDSADENAPGMLTADAYGVEAADDPTVPNAGTGKGYRDRGAYEAQDFSSAFTPAGPTRLLDTREAVGVPGRTAVPAGGTVDLQVAGVAGVPASGITAVTLNVTVTDTQQSGFLTVYPHGDPLPSSSNLNWTAGTTIPNLVTVPVRDGKVSFHNSSGGTVNVVADLAGYHSGKGFLFHPHSPTRLLDTREAVGVPGRTAVPAGGTVDLQVAGVAGLPASGVTAVTMNVTVTEPTQEGFLTVFPHGDALPNASNLNWPAGRTIPNLVTVPVKDGKVSFHNSSGGTVHVIADLAGYYTAEGRLTFMPVGPWRVADTREYIRYELEERPAGTVPAGGTLDIPVADVNLLASVTLNVTVTEPGTGGFLTVYPFGEQAPNASNLNFERGETIANQVVVPIGQNGKISIRNNSGAPVHIVVDTFGFEMY